MEDIAADLTEWAASGAMAITGRRSGPPSAAPASLASAMVAAADDLATQTGRWGTRVALDGPALLGERAAITGMTRNGDTSVGGSARFVPAADGWVVLNLPRPEDVASLPALVGRDVSPDDWPRIASALAAMPADDIVAQAGLLGLAVSAPSHTPAPVAPGAEIARGGYRTPRGRPLVVDLSSLWAGPLAGSLLAAAGARVVKVEGRNRPDGARSGAVPFFDLLNAGKECVQIDFRDRDDRRFLRRLIAQADLVIEASRPRVMEELGVVPEVVAASGTSWLSLTAYGRTGAHGARIGFGDDAAVAGGLYVPDDPPMFVADAVADPISGLVAAALGAELLGGERAAMVEVPLARAAAWAARPLVDAPVVATGDHWEVVFAGERIPVASPRHRPVAASAAPAGAHDASLRAEFPELPG